MSMRPSKVIAGLAIAMAAGLAVPPALATGQAKDLYVDAIDYPNQEDGWDSFFTLERRLFRDFDEICGDTFCEGEYSNIQALRYRCSIERATGFMGECVFVLAASNQEIDQATGWVKVDAPVWRCKTPLAPNTKADDFFRTLAASRYPLHEPLPDTDDSIYDGLANCL
jgi:hypothetical protein